MCNAAGVILAFLLPYSPDLNPIEEFFSELKAWIKKNYSLAIAYTDFGGFLDLAVQQISELGRADDHFRNAGIGLE